MNIITFNKEYLEKDLKVFKNLPKELQHYIYDYIKYDVYNSEYSDYNWYDNLHYLCRGYCLETIFDIINKNVPKKYEIKPEDMYDVGMYEEKVKLSVWGRRYIWIEDVVDNEKAVNLIINRIDNYICSKDYDVKKMFNINFNLISLIEYDDSDSDYNDDENHVTVDLGFEDYKQDILRTYNITY
tara:strand:+ start:123 stop:674 length:552 start_codon:yes stop_codon:yes gene_type:complete